MPTYIMIKSFIVNFLLVVIKIIAGVFLGSVALISDGIHSMSDLASDIVVIFGMRHSSKPPDKEHPFGHGKFEYVLSLFIGISILFVAYQLIMRLITQFDVVTIPSLYGILVALFVIVVKALLSRYLIAKGEALESSVVMASGKESYADVVSSVVVMFGIGLSVIGDATGIGFLAYADRVAGLIIAVFIIKIAIEILMEAVQAIQGRSVPQTVLNKTKDTIEKVEGVISVDHLDMIVYGHYYQVMIAIRVDATISVREGHDIAHLVKKSLKDNEKIAHVIVHVNPEE